MRGVPERSDASPAVANEGGPVTLDCLGQKCPLPVIKLAQNIRNVQVGETITGLADDPAAANDIPAWWLPRAERLRGAARQLR